MTFLIIHNIYSKQGGEETVVDFQKRLLESKGHKVILYERDYKEMDKWFLGKAWGTFTSIYNRKSIRDLKKIIQKENIDVAILHNLLPIISPCIIPFLKRHNIKVWQIVHNYRLLCPIGLFFTKGEICEKCLSKHREWNCLKNKCNGGLFSSFSYSFKFFLIRQLKYYDKVDRFYTLSLFQKDKFIQNGFDEKKIMYLPNTFVPEFKCENINLEEKHYISFVGRLTKEKGFFDFVDIAKNMPNYEFRVAGEKTKDIENIELPSNLHFEGFLNKKQMSDFYKNSKVILFLSRWYEGFPMVLVEAMYYYTPLIVNNLSVMAEVIKNNEEGFVVEIGDRKAIQEKIENLFTDKDSYEKIANRCRKEFETQYSVEKYYNRLIEKE